MLCDASLKLLSQGIFIGDPVYTGGQNHYYPLYQNVSYKQIVCQSPWLRLSTPPRYIKRNTHRVYFIDFILREKKHGEQGLHQPQQQWIQFLSRIQVVFQKWLQKSPQYASYRWIDSLETIDEYAFANTHANVSDCSRNVKWKITTSFASSLKYFDMNQNETTIQQFFEIKTPQTIRIIVHFNQLWVNTHSRTAGLSVQILQVQDQNIFPLVQCAFQSTSSDNVSTRSIGIQTDATLLEEQTLDVQQSIKQVASKQADIRCSHPVYGTYFKMINKGVPKPAVQHKMRMNGLDPAILDMESLESIAHQTDAPQQDQLTLSLKDDHQLKKTEMNTHQKKESTSAGHGFSLHEIMSGLQSLRKTVLPTKTKEEHLLEHQQVKKISLQSTQKSNSFLRLLGSSFL